MLTLGADGLHPLIPFPDILDLLTIFAPLHCSKVLFSRHLKNEHVLLRQVEDVGEGLDKLVWVV